MTSKLLRLFTRTPLHVEAGASVAAIRNRRSTLMREKGFGLGMCGTWDFQSGKPSL